MATIIDDEDVIIVTGLKTKEPEEINIDHKLSIHSVIISVKACINLRIRNLRLEKFQAEFSGY